MSRPFILLHLVTLIMSGEGYKSRSSLLRHFFHPPVTSSLWGQAIPLSTLFSNTLHPCSSHNVIDQVSYPYKTTRSYTVTLVTAMVTLTRIEGLSCCGHRQPVEQRDRHSAMTTRHTPHHTTPHTQSQQQLRSRPVCCPFYSNSCASEVLVYWDVRFRCTASGSRRFQTTGRFNLKGPKVHNKSLKIRVTGSFEMSGTTITASQPHSSTPHCPMARLCGRQSETVKYVSTLQLPQSLGHQK